MFSTSSESPRAGWGKELYRYTRDNFLFRQGNGCAIVCPYITPRACPGVRNVMPREKHTSDPANDGAGKITIKGARTHNLKNITVEMPRGKMIVFTGLSGSGKSSLAFDTIFA